MGLAKHRRLTLITFIHPLLVSSELCTVALLGGTEQLNECCLSIRDRPKVRRKHATNLSWLNVDVDELPTLSVGFQIAAVTCSPTITDTDNQV